WTINAITDCREVDEDNSGPVDLCRVRYPWEDYHFSSASTPSALHPKGDETRSIFPAPFLAQNVP
ncbi:MAG: hypothetical protein AAGF75_05670, partial [Cyanobacteria bacterium P01_H01_bin.130]